MDMSLVDLGKRLLESAKLGETEEVRVLMTNGAPFTTDWLGTSPLHMAAQYGHVETAEVLLRGGISRDARTKVDRTPLHIAAQEGHLEIVKLLINHGAEVDARDMLKMTPLHWAVERDHFYVVDFLLKCDADISAQNKFDKSPLDIAEDNQNTSLIELLTSPVEVQQVKQYSKSKVIQLNQPSASAATRVANSTVPLFLKNNTKSYGSAMRRTNPIPSVSPVITLTNPVKFNVSKPSQMFVQTSLGNLQSATSSGATLHKMPSSDSEESERGESNDASSNVLATLATLAEATMPYPTISSADALKWLELNGIPMLPSDSSTIIASALESGQTVALTEAGKLALTWAKQQHNSNSSSKVSSTTQKSGNSTAGSQSSTNQKVITIVTDHSRLPSMMSTPQTPIVVLNNPAVSLSDSTPQSKRFKPISPKEVKTQVINGNTVCLTPEDDERLKLKLELEKIKRQAEVYRMQLILKEHEAAEYKKQIEKMKTTE